MLKSRVYHFWPSENPRYSLIYIIEYVSKYASKEAADEDDKDSDDDDEMSSVGSYESGDEDEEAAGNMEDI